MDICGTVYVSKDHTAFLLRCTLCDKHVQHWTEFVDHVKNCPNAGFNFGTDCLDEFNDFKPEQRIKQENHGQTNSSRNEESIKDEFFSEFVNEDEDEEADETMQDYDRFDEESMSDSSDDSETNAETIKEKSACKFSPSFYRRCEATTEFIKLYKSHTCLWDTNDSHHNDSAAEKKALDAMIENIHKKFKVPLTVREIKGFISKMRQQYYITQEDMKKGTISKFKAIASEHYKMCAFLGVIEEEQTCSKNIYHENKFLVFNNFDKCPTDVFIKMYSSHPVLYDPNHTEYASNVKRKCAYVAITEALKKNYGERGLTPDKLYRNILSLRHWYYTTCERKNEGQQLSKEELKYLELCKFLPPRVEKPQLKCQECGKVLKTEATLQVHMVEAHNIGEMPFKCDQCDRGFKQRSALQTHLQRQHLDKPFECEYCHHKFGVIADYRLHVRTHTEEKPYVCEQCGKAFRVRVQLSYHITAIHTKVRAFKCTMCPKDFIKPVHLRDHIKSHLNIRDKICETCGKGFTNCHSLIRHRQIHSEVKKFACKLCDAKFHQFVGLNSHMKRTHNIVKNKPCN